ncbi:hypothetical protein PUNSTDRAFT_143642 [Punctularia strigosozonata HHB-11173 SS5]|uniref:uncharacterized protein n=1 Tax=Punctularia strigosozonata (strain HHB-11173) TaxID=741275 RepID=UPI0004418449|nr:uncharacterized protein PUNSTDRAFT_143642 [Punctularia strigosozonata HHB-11173 SS5]EIN09007.1 hypothetical protein PUNSTDRAFT_143642 [Punctularia strigosozonata HHB-11173 SS5]
MAPKNKNQHKRQQGRSHKPQSQPVAKAFPNSATQEAFSQKIDDAGENWEDVVSLLCEYLEIPTLTKRKGLKQIHARFDSVYERLDAAYKMFQEQENEMVMGGIIGIFAKMCTDALLRDKLFKKGVLSKLVPLLDSETCRHLALRSLATMTHHAGVDARVQIACYTRKLLKLMKDRPDDYTTQELSVVVIGHAVSAVIYDGDKSPDLKALKDFNLTETIQTMLESAKKPGGSAYLIGHALHLVESATYNCPEEYDKNPSATKFLVAFLRSDDLSIRASVLGALLRLHAKKNEYDRTQYDPQKIMAAVSSGKWPPHVNDAMMDYGPMRCDVFVMLKTMNEFQRTMINVVQTHDFYNLGKTLAEFITRTEFSVAEGRFEAQNASTGEWEKDGSVGLPFTLWSEALPHAAKVIKEKGKADEAYMADILELKFLVMRQRVHDAIPKAHTAILRNPDVAYFYYVVSLTADHEVGLRYAKKGLRCKKGLTPFVKTALLNRSVEHAGDLGITALLESHIHGHKWEEGIAFLMSAWEDAKVYMTEAPPDARNMKTVINWYIVLTLAIKGKEVNPDLGDLRDAFDKLRVSEDVAMFLGAPLFNTQLRLTRTTVVKDYVAAQKEWGEVVGHFDEVSEKDAGARERESIDPEKATNDLASWLNELQVDDEGDDDDTHSHVHEPCEPPRRVTTNSVSLYRCSYCGNPSAALKKCGGCGNTSYCDASCQKNHWKAHKNQCQKS